MAWTADAIRFGQDGAGSVSWSAACGASVSNWVSADKLVVAAWFSSSDHTPGSKSVKLQWRNKTDNPSGSFADFVTGSGELRSGVSAGALVNTTTVTTGSGCFSSSFSEEVENESPLQSASFSPAKSQYIETQWCIDMSNALGGKEYEFQVWDVTGSASLGIFAYTVTLAAGAQTYYQTSGQYALGPTGGIGKVTSSARFGVYSLASVGALGTSCIFKATTGEYAVASAGAISTLLRFTCAVGSGVVDSLGSIVKKISVGVGNYAVSIIGWPQKMVTSFVGGASLGISGAIQSSAVFFQTAGGYAVAAIGAVVGVARFVCSAGGWAISSIGALSREKISGMGETAKKMFKKAKMIVAIRNARRFRGFKI